MNTAQSTDQEGAHGSGAVNRIDEVTIVGGGTAGWLTAMVLNTTLNIRRSGPPVRITLIESPNVPTIGVGEATVPGMPNLLRQLRIDESAFFKATNASFKLGVRFVDWQLDDAGRPTSYIHPFNSAPAVGGYLPAYHYHRFGRPEGCEDLADAVAPNSSVIKGYLGPRPIGGKEYEGLIGYAYHLDAALFAKFLRSIALERGVRHVVDDVVDVRLAENGFVSALHLKDGGLMPVQFVVDCTGFRGLIIQKALGEPFESYGDQLLCDSALAVQLPHQDPEHLEPCTRSTALGAGWCWRVPLYTRVGTGYVFSSRFRSDDAAMDEFMEYLGDHGKGAEPRVIRMRVGRTRNAWVKNCAAIGLSGGFIEPLESTAIYMIEMAARWLSHYFPNREVSPALAEAFNGHMRNLTEEVRDFIVTHYYTSNRQDPFWIAARSEIELSDRLRARLELWRHTLPGSTDTAGDKLFSFWNYLYVLYCKGYFKEASFPLAGSVDQGDWQDYTRRLNDTKADLRRQLPNHYALLTSIRAQAGEAAAPGFVPRQFAGQDSVPKPAVPLPE
jgi:hypothetical protein